MQLWVVRCKDGVYILAYRTLELNLICERNGAHQVLLPKNDIIVRACLCPGEGLGANRLFSLSNFVSIYLLIFRTVEDAGPYNTLIPFHR